MYSGMLIVLLPLALGYCIPCRSQSLVHFINVAVERMVYLILFLMGISLAFVDNLSTHLGTIFILCGVFLACITLCNLAGLWLLDLRRGRLTGERGVPVISKWALLLDSAKLCLVILAGLGAGQFLDPEWFQVDTLSEWALMLLLLLIGIQLRNSGMKLRQILLNRWGLAIALTVMVSSWVGGLLGAWLMNLPLTQGLAFASGNGWYSLSGILIGDKLGPVMGSAAFLNDLARELIAIMIIPTLMRRHPSCAIGYGGATSMDFTLPVLQRSGGVAIVPVAIVSGFVLSLAGPVLILGFLSFTTG
ncbi:lysine exporter LysO family protein [Oceanimonas baumannii]|uniref:lysine exporter LysO family protein n=1 Tax=Oceanimonas baumannii TaxID=129578 RepID=UPI001D194965|nr:lysine exporter LysO family protein [Oceanimonas baumannii]MCC4263240.1 lysine exporter LysO family protein [Oceanimonas baumannii]